MGIELFEGLDTKSLANAGVEVEIMKSDGESSGVFITVLGQDSDAYNKIKERQDRARLRALSKGGRGATDLLYNTSKVNEMELICACCLEWRHANGRPLPFKIGAQGDEEQTHKLFTDYPLLYDQLRVAIADRINFTKTPATS